MALNSKTISDRARHWLQSGACVLWIGVPACKEPPPAALAFAVPGTPGHVRCDCATLLPLSARGELPHIADKPARDMRCEYAPTGATGSVRTLIVAVGRAATVDAPAALPVADPLTSVEGPVQVHDGGIDGVVAIETSNVGSDLVSVTRAGALRIRTEEQLGADVPSTPPVPAYLRTLALAAPAACRGD